MHKKGFTLIECIIYMFIGTIIVSISLKILINTSISYKKLVNNLEDMNTVENTFINLERLFKDETIKKIIVSGDDKVEIYKRNEERYNIDQIPYEKAEIIKLKNNLVINYYEFFTEYKLQAKNVLIENIDDFKILRKGKLRYLIITKGGREYARCI